MAEAVASSGWGEGKAPPRPQDSASREVLGPPAAKPED